MANNRVMVLWEQHKTMRRAIREYVDNRGPSSAIPYEHALLDIRYNGAMKSTFLYYPHTVHEVPNSRCGPDGRRVTMAA